MILDVMENKDLYLGVHKGFAAAFAFMEKAMQEGVEPGRHEIDGENVYAVVHEYDTKDTRKWECHRKYIDIQVVLEGREIIAWDTIANLPEGVAYSEEGDCSVFDMDGGSDVVMEKGMYCILFPQDLHAPGNTIGDTPSHVKKMVVKIAV